VLMSRFSPVSGHPKVQKAAVFDIITPDLLSGPIAAGAEIIALANDCLNSFPNLSPNYDIHTSHSRSMFLIVDDDCRNSSASISC
jgi:eukaryotic translation initiation factor 2-alpha kinase 4